MYFPLFGFWRTVPMLLTGSPVLKNITTKGDLYILNGNTKYTNPHGTVIERPAILGRLGPEDPGTFPAPIINGWKVIPIYMTSLSVAERTFSVVQGETFEINVHNDLTDSDMLRELTIVGRIHSKTLSTLKQIPIALARY